MYFNSNVRANALLNQRKFASKSQTNVSSELQQEVLTRGDAVYCCSCHLDVHVVTQVENLYCLFSDNV
jgi:hypothetical protein